MLPLMHASDTIGRVIGAMSAESSPHWLGHDRLRDKRLVRHELIWPDGRPQPNVQAVRRQPIAPTSYLGGAAKGDRRAFRVLDGGRK